jgi:hypothetical protein
VTVGFDARDWSDTRRPRRHRSFSDPPVPVYRWVNRVRLDPVFAADPDRVDSARGKLAHQLDRHAQDHGLEVLEVNWSTAELADPHQIELELSAQLRPRLDGEWASIRAAIEEDQADREEARLADGGVVRADEIEDRLDALRETVGVWTAKTPAEVREELEGVAAARRGGIQGYRPPSPITRDVRDRDYTR